MEVLGSAALFCAFPFALGTAATGVTMCRSALLGDQTRRHAARHAEARVAEPLGQSHNLSAAVPVGVPVTIGQVISAHNRMRPIAGKRPSPASSIEHTSR